MRQLKKTPVIIMHSRNSYISKNFNNLLKSTCKRPSDTREQTKCGNKEKKMHTLRDQQRRHNFQTQVRETYMQETVHPVSKSIQTLVKISVKRPKDVR